jgi:hypothetical protein
LDYLFLDASFFRMHPGSPAEPGPGRLGHHHRRQARLRRPPPGSGESADAWHDFLQDLKGRGLASLLLVISDGARAETSCLTLVWAVLDRASRGWRGLTMTSDDLRLLQNLLALSIPSGIRVLQPDLRRSLLELPRQLRPRTATAGQAGQAAENVSIVA